jgi:hypothetical protein
MKNMKSKPFDIVVDVVLFGIFILNINKQKKRVK